MEPEEFGKDLEAAIQAAIDSYNGRAVRTQRRTLKNLLELIQEYDISKTKTVKPTVKNLKTNNRIKKQLSDIVNDPQHQSSVESLVSDLESIKREMGKYLSSLGPVFDSSNKVLEEIVNNAIATTRNTLLESGYENTVITELEAILTENVTTGSRFSDMIQQMSEYMIGTPEINGRLVRYSKLFVNDTMNQFVRNYIGSASAGLDIKTFLYSGGLVVDSREFCVTRNGKVWHIEEIRGWGTVPAKWQGRNPATNSSNIFYILGGYNCEHTLIPTLNVPESDRLRMEGKGLV